MHPQLASEACDHVAAKGWLHSAMEQFGPASSETLQEQQLDGWTPFLCHPTGTGAEERSELLIPVPEWNWGSNPTIFCGHIPTEVPLESPSQRQCPGHAARRTPSCPPGASPRTRTSQAHHLLCLVSRSNANSLKCSLTITLLNLLYSRKSSPQKSTYMKYPFISLYRDIKAWSCSFACPLSSIQILPSNDINSGSDKPKQTSFSTAPLSAQPMSRGVTLILYSPGTRLWLTKPDSLPTFPFMHSVKPHFLWFYQDLLDYDLQSN